MSGIAGIFYRNNKPVQLEQLQAMGAALAHRGPDGINYYFKDSVGLVHCMLHDTPESLFETLPNQSDEGNFVITFHGRIDNRQELYDKIGWNKPISKITDSDLVLAAYKKWRRECVDHLLGDFAFAIWSDLEKKLFCARDQMGVKPFYYYENDRIFAFASEIKGILVLGEVPRVLNEGRVADYFTIVVSDKQSTFYQGILRLPPGYFLLVSNRSHFIYQYYELKPAACTCSSDEEFENQFQELFSRAVTVRLRSHAPIGSFLSGGLDSASIVCVAASLLGNEQLGKFHTFSGIFETLKECDERKYISTVLERYNLKSHTICIDTINPAKSYEKLISEEDEPFWAPHTFMSMELFSLAQSLGVRVMLDGHDGDAAVSHGYSIFSELALTLKVKQLIDTYREAGVVSLTSLVNRIIRLYWNIFCVKASLLPVFQSAGQDTREILSILNTEFSKRIGAKKRVILSKKASPSFGQNELKYHLANISQPIHVYALEFLEREAIRHKIVSRYPYFDIRLLEFCLAVPAAQKFRSGTNRNIVRRALRDVLPDSIRLRKDKTNFTPSMLHAFSRNDREWLASNIDNLYYCSYDYLSKSSLFCANNSFVICESKKLIDLSTLLTSVCFARWLVKNKEMQRVVRDSNKHS